MALSMPPEKQTPIGRGGMRSSRGSISRTRAHVASADLGDVARQAVACRCQKSRVLDWIGTANQPMRTTWCAGYAYDG